MKSTLVVVIWLALALPPAAAYGTVWDLNHDFSATQNPNGAWAFGWRESASQPLILYTDTSPWPVCPWDPGVHSWSYQIYPTARNVSKNANDYSWSCNGCDYPPNVVWFHPGPTQQGVVRWTAPGDLRIALVARFQALDTGSSLVHIYRNGLEVYSATLPDLGAMAADSLTTTCHAGDIIDIAVDAISFTDDSVKLDVVINVVTTPATGACCFPSGSCLMGTADDCASAGGIYHGDDVPCDGSICTPTAVEGISWGLMKALYR